MERNELAISFFRGLLLVKAILSSCNQQKPGEGCAIGCSHAFEIGASGAVRIHEEVIRLLFPGGQLSSDFSLLFYGKDSYLSLLCPVKSQGVVVALLQSNQRLIRGLCLRCYEEAVLLPVTQEHGGLYLQDKHF